MYPRPIRQLIEAFSLLPSVGERTAERFVFFLLKSGKKEVAELSSALNQLVKEIKSCETCWDFSLSSPCPLCADSRRDRSLLCVVATPPDVQALEKTGQYKGLYHVLRGTLSPENQESLNELKIKELIHRARQPELREVILALNPDLAGETTMMYLQNQLNSANHQLRITRLARGLPMGSDLQYADEITLESALKNRLPTGP
ncbi:MAG TPA: recombination mediator RecR [Patescibacteria group bacterium]|nr:recombination mediator RecR [Patescibacteria group bacterium]